MTVSQTYLSRQLQHVVPTLDCQVTEAPPSCLYGLHTAALPLNETTVQPFIGSQGQHPEQPDWPNPETEWDAACYKFVIILPPPPTPTRADSSLPCYLALGERQWLPARGLQTLGDPLRWQWGRFLLKFSRCQISHWNNAHKFSSIL